MAPKFEQDLTQGNVWKQLLIFSLPFLASNLVQSCFNLADMIILGNYGGTYSLSGVSIGGGVMTVLTTFASGLATGGTVVIGNYLGAGHKNKINKVISTLLVTLGIIAITITIVLGLGVDPLLSLLKAPAESFTEAHNYLFICACGVIFIFGYNALASIMRGLGDAKTPMIFIILACILNIILDLILVAYYKIGAVGAALATIISQALAMISCIIYLKVNDFMFDFKPGSFRFYKEEFWLITKTGLPMSIQSVATNFSFLVLNSYNSRLGGVNASAAVAVVMNFNGFAILPSHAINQAATSMISQNSGKGDLLLKRSHEVVKACLIMCIIVSGIVFTLVRTFPEPIFHLFGAEEAVINCGIPYLLAFSFEYATLAFIVAYNSFLTGTGRGYLILITTLLSSFILRIPIAYLLGFILNMGIVGVAYAAPIATAFGALMSFIFFQAYKNRSVKIAG